MDIILSIKIKIQYAFKRWNIYKKNFNIRSIAHVYKFCRNGKIIKFNPISLIN